MRRRSFLKAIAGSVPGVAYTAHLNFGRQATVGEEGPKLITEKEGKDFLALARELAAEKRTVVGVLREPKFAGHEVPASLRPEHFLETWGARPDVRVVFLDMDQIRSYSILFKGRMDILVYPYGPMYPMDAWVIFSGDAVEHFLKRGGAVLTTGGVPFGLPVSDDGKPPVNRAAQQSDLSLDNEIYERWIAALGYKYYVHPYKPTLTHANQRFLPSLSATLKVDGCQLGIVANNSSHEPVPKCSHGNVFPERYPARQVMPLLWGTDKYDQILAVNALLIQDFETGSRRIHFAHQTEPHPLSPDSLHFSALMGDILSLLTNRLIAKDVEPNYACFRQGEPVRVRAELVSFESKDAEADVIFEIRGNGQVVDFHTESMRFPPKQTMVKEWNWTPQAFETDEYDVTVSVRRRDQTISSAENGFVVWNDGVVQHGPKVAIQGKYFRIGRSESFVAGTNYYESTRGEIMWYRPNVKRIAQDLRQMREHGVNYIRPHYHHLKWFKDYLLFQHGRLLDFFKGLEAVESPQPDERVWRTWDAFIYLCQKFGIVYGGDLFTLVPEEMGDPRGWFPLKEGFLCPEKRAVQRVFLRQINLRYKDAPGISWDLMNEPVVFGQIDVLRNWTDDLRKTLLETGVPRITTVGGGSGEQLQESIDYLAPHSRAVDIRERRTDLRKMIQSTKPVLMQEMHLDHQEDLKSELLQAEDMREGILAAVRSGFCGVAPWSWCRQMRLWQDSYEHDPSFPMEKWDDRLGTHVHDDGTIKPAGQVYRNLATLLRTVNLVAFNSSNGRITTDRGELVVKLKEAGRQEGYSLHHVSGPRCFAAMSLTSASWNGRGLVSGPASGYVYVFSEDGSDLATAKQIYVKSEMPGTLVVHQRAARPRNATLVDASPLGNKHLEPLSWSSSADGIEINMVPTQQAYWVLLKW